MWASSFYSQERLGAQGKESSMGGADSRRRQCPTRICTEEGDDTRARRVSQTCEREESARAERLDGPSAGPLRGNKGSEADQKRGRGAGPAVRKSWPVGKMDRTGAGPTGRIEGRGRKSFSFFFF